MPDYTRSVTPRTYDSCVANGWGDPERTGRVAGLTATAGAGAAVLGLILAGATGEPYLSADGVNGWLVVFAAGLLAAFVALPFGIEWRLRERFGDRDRRWEVALLLWGAIALAALVIGFLAGFDTGTVAGAAGLIAAIEAGLVVATIVTWLLAGG